MKEGKIGKGMGKENKKRDYDFHVATSGGEKESTKGKKTNEEEILRYDTNLTLRLRGLLAREMHRCLRHAFWYKLKGFEPFPYIQKSLKSTSYG